MDFSTKLTLPYILPNQAQKHVTMNESLRRLDALVQISVMSMTESTPPADPGAGAMLFVSDYPGGPVPVFSDGTNWRAIHNRAVL